MKKNIVSLLLGLMCLASWAQRPTALKSTSIPAGNITQVNVVPGTNVSNAFNQALTDNYVEGNTTNYLQLNIPNGTYELDEIASTAIFKINGKNNIIINGNGSTIIGQRLLRFFECNNSRNIIIKNFYVDHNPLPFSQGTVKSINVTGKYINVAVDANYPNPITDTRFKLPSNGGINSKLWLFIKDPTHRGMMKRGCNNVYLINKSKKWKRNPSNNSQIRIYLSSMTNIAAGDKWVMPISSAKNLVRINNSEQITVEDVVQYSGAGALIYSGNSSTTNFIRLKSMLKPNTNRIQANTRDGAIFSTNPIGPLFDGCVIEANGDDGINMNVSGNVLNSVNHAQKQIRLTSIENQFNVYPTIDIQAGDSIVFYKPSKEKEIHRGTVSSIVKTTVNGVKKATCIMNESIPSALVTTNGTIKIWNLTRANNYFVIKNSTFRYLRRQALFLYGRNGIIENNTFEKITVRAIETHTQGRLGYLPENVIIRNNLFKDNNVSQTDYNHNKGASVLFELTTNSSDNGNNPNAGKPIQNIKIRNNTFEEDCTNPAIIMTNCGNSSVHSNTFQSYYFPLSEIRSNAVVIEDADVAYSMQNNTFSRLYFNDAQILRFNSTINNSNSGTHNNGINYGHTYDRISVNGSGNIQISNFGETGYETPDAIAKQVLGDRPRTIQLRFKFKRDISSANSSGGNIFQVGTTSAGKYLRMFISSTKRLVVDLGGNKFYKTRVLSKNFSNSTKIELGINRSGGLKLKIDDNATSWAVTPDNVSIDTAPSDFKLFTNNSSLGGVTIYSFRIWNYNKIGARSATVTNINKDDANTLFIYPNPVQHKLNVQHNGVRFQQVKIFTVTGREVTANRTEFNNNHILIDCSNLTNGVYILQLVGEDDSVSYQKFQKLR
ncbi:T9SS type A sorting domain-containing protein [Prolixibacteraceae bacterium JC049]|nr:T9SS type A sorting domain-containing protein [Prolixibacteraceae bacterium JC049]